MIENGVSRGEDISAILVACGGTLMIAAAALGVIVAWTAPGDVILLASSV